MSLLTRQRVLLAKIETTAGTAESLSATDGEFNIYSDGPIITPEIPVTDRNGQSAFSKLASVPAGRAGRARFWTDLVGKGASGTPPWASTFLPACGMLETSGSFSFVTGSSSAKTLTISTYEDGTARTIYGAVGTWTINLKAGEIGRIEFDFLGIYGTDADVALPTPDYPSIIPPRFANSSAVTFNSVNPILSAVTLAAGNTLKVREDANTTPGFKAGIITDRTPTFSLDPELVVVATKNWMTDFLASTQASLAVVVGTASNNIITITYPKAQITTPPTRGDRDGLFTNILTGIATRNADAGDDECTLVLT